MSLFPFSIAMPGAGGNWQTIDTRWWSPDVTVNFAGNPMIEREVNEEVASYGSQIGWLNDVVLALVAIEGKSAVKDHLKEANSLQRLEAARAKIDAIKGRRAESAYEKARDALAQLEKTDNARYQRLLRACSRDEPSSTR